MNGLSSDFREQSFNRLTEGPLDLLIIGGGIVGAGVARDAAMRGLRVALVDQHDFGFGTSSRSSRLLHGGLRYLAQGRLGLVREASVEKKILHEIAPHLASALAFVFPTYKGQPDWAFWKMRLGVKLYDLLCGGRNLGQSTSLNCRATAGHLPGINERGLTGAVRYFDALTNDARLVIDTLRSATNHGAAVLNYTQFVNARRTDGLWASEVTDRLMRRKGLFHTRAIVNATGPWAQGLSHSQVKLRLTKGIHLVIERERLPVPDAVVMTEGKRILFAIPWADRVILGTTDTDYEGSLDEVFAEPEEIAYVLRVVNGFFPSARIMPQDVISTWAGLRPLIADPRGRPSDISRSHQIQNPEPGWWDVAGGKLTTYRLMAEQTVDRIARELGLRIPPSPTAKEPLLSAEQIAGSHVAPPEFSREAVEHFCTHEWAVHLDDVMVRRSSWQHYHRNASGKAEQVAEWMAQIFGWDEAEKNCELSRYFKQTGTQPPAARQEHRISS